MIDDVLYFKFKLKVFSKGFDSATISKGISEQFFVYGLISKFVTVLFKSV